MVVLSSGSRVFCLPQLQKVVFDNHLKNWSGIEHSRRVLSPLPVESPFRCYTLDYTIIHA